MHGQITLESALDRGTTATFSIPFNRPQYPNRDSPLIDIGSLPTRLQSDISVSGCGSDEILSNTPPQSPLDVSSLKKLSRSLQFNSNASSRTVDSGQTMEAKGLDRKRIHVLVVEDK